MGQKNIADYLDSGFLGVFGKQIVECLEGAIAAAIYNPDDKLVWAGPNEGDSKRFSVNPLGREHTPGPGFCEEMDHQTLAYVFYLKCEGSDDLMGTLKVLVEAADPVSFDVAYRELQPILTCIERQVAINAEISSVRRISSQDRDGLELLLKMDELDGSAGPEEILQSVLELATVQFGCTIAAVSLPQLGIQQTHPATALTDPDTAESLVATLDRLNLAAKKYKKVLASDDKTRLNKVMGSGQPPAKILCSPIVNFHDDVTGIFVLIGPHALPKKSLRVVRAICAKINSLTRAADQVSSEHYSRNGLLQHVNAVLLRHPNVSHAFLYMDIDQLHVVNDSFGHMAGDQVIRRTIGIVDDLTDTNDAISHLSGDRLGIFLRDCNEQEALEKAGLILQTLERDTVEYDGKVITISASIGIALMPDVVTDASAALNTAVVAARSAKERGGGRIVVFRDMDASISQRRIDLDQVGHLQSAFIDDRFTLHAQRIQSLKKDESSNRFEILVRMVDENDQLVPPDKFISAAERYQLMSALDRWVIKKTLSELGSSENVLEVNLASFSINVSAQSLTDDDFTDQVARCVMDSGVSPDSLCFEITETAIVRNLDRAKRFIRKLRKLGCRLALDDFGTGHCSFAYLKDLPVQYIKIDGVFVRDILENPLSDAIVSSMTKIAKVMHARTVAEHVESDLVLQRLRQHDIDFVQGFAIDRPRPLSEVLAEMGPAVLFETTSNLI